ncbi:MAG: hypothetical protein O2783_06605 [Chloroflexi bacterium]|nr:hypothetical protein [Chloroflexota bacterium]
MNEEIDDKLPVEQNGEEEMAEFKCPGCDVIHLIQYHGYGSGSHSNYGGRIQGTVTCGRDINPDRSSYARRIPCNEKIVFEISENTVSFLPGNLLRQNLKTRAEGVHENARAMIEEALKCFYGGSYVGVIAMCRSAVIEEILGKDVGNRDDNVPGLVDKAKKRGLVDAQDEVRAISAGLIAREALHHMGDVTQDDALFAIRAGVEFVNNVAGRTPKPAKP